MVMPKAALKWEKPLSLTHRLDGTTRPNWGTGPPPWVTGSTGAQPPACVTSGAVNPFLSATASEPKFGLMSVGFSMPVSIKIKNTTLSFSPNLAKPVHISSFESFLRKPQFNFSLSLA